MVLDSVVCPTFGTQVRKHLPQTRPLHVHIVPVSEILGLMDPLSSLELITLKSSSCERVSVSTKLDERRFLELLYIMMAGFLTLLQHVHQNTIDH